MARGVYRTAQGKFINMDNLRLQNEQERAIGNMKVNARGDKIDNQGNVVKRRNEVIKDHYSQTDLARQAMRKPK
jgi:hypothetical protein